MSDDEVDGKTIREIVQKRSDVLASIADEPATKPTLLDRLDISRSTVDRAIDSLASVGLIRRVDGQYRITANGELVLTARCEYVETTDALAEAAPLLNTVAADVSIAPSLLETGTVRIAEPHAPENAITEAVRKLQSAEQLLVFSPVVKSNYVRPVNEQVQKRDLDTTLILEQGATESLTSLADVTGTVEELLASDSFSLLSTDRQLPFLLYVMLGSGPDTVGVTVHEDGGIVGSIVADDPDAVAWGREFFEDVRSTASPVQPSQLLP